MSLPDFPWDRLAPLAEVARSHESFADLSIGSPVDPTPIFIQDQLAAAANAPGYPTVAGTEAVRGAFVDWLRRRGGVEIDPLTAIPSIGSKELVALLPFLLSLGPGDRVVVPTVAYPTYAVGALVAGCEVVVSDDPAACAGARLVWVNSPCNPSGRVASAHELRAMVEAARAAGAVLASDECYLEFGYDATPVSVLHPSVIGADPTRVLSLHALSKRSNMAGYRFGAVAGDPALISRLLEIRKHLGLMVPAPVQHAAAAAWADDAHVDLQRDRYLGRRAVLRPALEAAGFRIDHSEAGLYLWATRGQECWQTVADLARLGVLAAPGDFYGEAGARHVRLALTATDEAIRGAAERIRAGDTV
ncbi:MAG: succinyldiaminopimelate transaminase [Actinobacteria bacterium]|nr:succinyldiaminopimelate transaminase [Actinomycetota bacterium]